MDKPQETIYKAIVDRVKNEHEKYDLTYTAFRALIHSQGLCEGLIEEIITIYEELNHETQTRAS